MQAQITACEPFANLGAMRCGSGFSPRRALAFSVPLASAAQEAATPLSELVVTGEKALAAIWTPQALSLRLRWATAALLALTAAAHLIVWWGEVGDAAWAMNGALVLLAALLAATAWTRRPAPAPLAAKVQAAE